VDLPTALFRDLLHLSSSVGLDDDALTTPLVALVAGLQAAVPSYRGLHLTLVENGHPVSLAAFLHSEDAESITTSLRLPLAALGPGFDPDSRVVFYAATPGAFVDLAADLGYALGIRTIALDAAAIRPGTPTVTAPTTPATATDNK
jgi:acetaldehyde dehydrogenase (acetylating)